MQGGRWGGVGDAPHARFCATGVRPGLLLMLLSACSEVTGSAQPAPSASHARMLEHLGQLHDRTDADNLYLGDARLHQLQAALRKAGGKNAGAKRRSEKHLALLHFEIGIKQGAARADPGEHREPGGELPDPRSGPPARGVAALLQRPRLRDRDRAPAAGGGPELRRALQRRVLPVAPRWAWGPCRA